MKFYIDGPLHGGEGIYSLVAETGELLAQHYCSHAGYARGDLEANRPARQAEWLAEFGAYEVLVVPAGDMTREELHRRNEAYHLGELAAEATRGNGG